jgi:hypothetical protein
MQLVKIWSNLGHETLCASQQTCKNAASEQPALCTGCALWDALPRESALSQHDRCAASHSVCWKSYWWCAASHSVCWKLLVECCYAQCVFEVIGGVLLRTVCAGGYWWYAALHSVCWRLLVVCCFAQCVLEVTGGTDYLQNSVLWQTSWQTFACVLNDYWPQDARQCMEHAAMTSLVAPMATSGCPDSPVCQ